MAGVGLLFVALAFFAVGQAEDSRNGTQTAADAAALGAAKDARDGMGPQFLDALRAGDLELIQDLLDGKELRSGHCAAASSYAERNGARVQECVRVHDPAGYRVDVRSEDSIGDSVIDGTEDKHAVATATAVIEPRCALSPRQEDPTEEPDGDPSSPADEEDEDEDEGDSEEEPGPVTFDCDEGGLSLDPGDPELDLDLGDLFVIRLTK